MAGLRDWGNRAWISDSERDRDQVLRGMRSAVTKAALKERIAFSLVCIPAIRDT